MKDCKGTLIEQILELRNEYFEKYGKFRQERNKKKEEIRKKYEKQIQVANDNKKDKKHINELYRKRKEEVSIIDCPVLKRYYLARSAVYNMSEKKQVNYEHLIKTFTLSCRDEFECLDTEDRVLNFKTPRKQLTTAKPPMKKRRLVDTIAAIKCDHWTNGKVFCKFCSEEFLINSKSKRKYSHLLYECKGIPGDGPLPKASRPPEKKRIKRLAEIGVAPDPGGSPI